MNIAPHLKDAPIEHGREHQCLRQTRQPELLAEQGKVKMSHVLK